MVGVQDVERAELFEPLPERLDERVVLALRHRLGRARGQEPQAHARHERHGVGLRRCGTARDDVDVVAPVGQGLGLVPDDDVHAADLARPRFVAGEVCSDTSPMCRGSVVALTAQP